uniref:Secreted protein n=1 Tax=Anopheles coluzzii TaxID=1518534 RepID=A0A8W7PVB5_ANOCL
MLAWMRAISASTAPIASFLACAVCSSCCTVRRTWSSLACSSSMPFCSLARIRGGFCCSPYERYLGCGKNSAHGSATITLLRFCGTFSISLVNCIATLWCSVTRIVSMAALSISRFITTGSFTLIRFISRWVPSCSCTQPLRTSYSSFTNRPVKMVRFCRSGNSRLSNASSVRQSSCVETKNADRQPPRAVSTMPLHFLFRTSMYCPSGPRGISENLPCWCSWRMRATRAGMFVPYTASLLRGADSNCSSCFSMRVVSLCLAHRSWCFSSRASFTCAIVLSCSICRASFWIRVTRSDALRIPRSMAACFACTSCKVRRTVPYASFSATYSCFLLSISARYVSIVLSVFATNASRLRIRCSCSSIDVRSFFSSSSTAANCSSWSITLRQASFACSSLNSSPIRPADSRLDCFSSSTTISFDRYSRLFSFTTSTSRAFLAITAHSFSFCLMVSIWVAFEKNVYCLLSSESFSSERAKSWFSTQIGLSTWMLNASSIFCSSARLVDTVWPCSFFSLYDPPPDAFSVRSHMMRPP